MSIMYVGCCRGVLLVFTLFTVQFPYINKSFLTSAHRHHAPPPLSSSDTNLQNQAVPDYVVKQRDEVHLVCDVLINPSDIVWLHNGELVDFGHRYSRSATSLNIANVRLEDDGYWQCRHRDNSNLYAKPKWLLVLESPREPYLSIDGRRLDKGNLFIPVKENQALTIECIVEGGNPRPSLHWVLEPSEHNMDTAPNLVFGEPVTPKTGPMRSEAKIERVVRQHHNATVMCLVNHVTLLHQALNASLLLDVQYTPSFAISRTPGFGIPLVEGIPVSLKCEVDSNPASSPIWQKDNDVPPVEQSPDGFLNFSSISREHSGWYKCTSRHLLTDYSSIGYFLNVRYDPPEIEVTPDEMSEEASSLAAVEVTLGGAVTLQCPNGAAGCWSRVGLGGRLEAVGPGPKLSLSRVLYQEGGEYRCLVGRSSKLDRLRSHNVQVSVVGAPVVYPNSSHLIGISGQPVTLSVEFCANPPPLRTFWISETSSRIIRPDETRSNEGLISIQLTNSTTPYCYTSSLSFSAVSPSDAGQYLFLVKSVRGLAEASIVLSTALAKDPGGSYHGNVVITPTSGTESLETVGSRLLLLVLCTLVLGRMINT
uniref:Cell adhesion molecule 3 n=1 Tax=Cacopsylla melanoneura TaxID=428564 RepID=A0A8D9ACH1_9HEMI